MMGRVSGVPYQVELPGIFTGSTLRPATDQMFMSIALVASTRATCVRRRGGCVLVNNKNHILSLGYNGQPSGFEHCIDNPCGGSCNAPGEGLDECEAIHAEANAITRLKVPAEEFEFYMKDFSMYLLKQVKSMGYDYIEDMQLTIKYKEHEQNREPSESV